LGDFAALIAREFDRYMDSRELPSSSNALTSVRKFFRYLLSETSRERSFTSSDYWHAALRRWRAWLSADIKITHSSKCAYFNSVKSFLRHLQVAGVIPKFSIARGFKQSVSPNRKKTLAETTSAFTTLDQSDSEKIRGFEAEVSAIWREIKTTSSEDIARLKTIELLNIYLRVLRGAAEIEMKQIWETHLKTLRLVKEKSAATLKKRLASNDGRYSRARGYGGGSKALFEDEEDALIWLYDVYDGVIPSRFEDEKLYRLLVNKFSGIANLSSRFHLTPDTAVPFCIPILIDTAMNVGCLYRLSKKCSKPSHQSGFTHITWPKNRSRGRVLSIDIPNGKLAQINDQLLGPVTATMAIACLQRLRRPLEKLARRSDRDKLLLLKSMDSVRSLSNGTLRGAWSRFRKRHPILSGLPIRLDQIRPTMLLKCALETNGNIFSVRELGQHKSMKTTERYIGSLIVTALGNAKVRRIQDYIFVAATRGDPELSDRLGLNKAHADLLLREARRMGFSLSAEVVEKRSSGNVSEQLTYRFVIADARSVAEMSAFRRHILASQARLIREAPQRWQKVWAPFAAFLGIAIDRMPPDIKTTGRRLEQKSSHSFAVLQ
jgi:hypothetical protein